MLFLYVYECMRVHVGEGELWAGGGLCLFPSSVTAVRVGAAVSPGLSGCSQLVPICGQWELDSARSLAVHPIPAPAPSGTA